LVTALFAMLIIVAVGVYALTMTSQDIGTTGRYVCERRSFSAADTGLTALCQAFDPNTLVAGTNIQVDPANDPSSTYSYTKPTRNTLTPSVPASGSDIVIGKNWIFELYNGSVTGAGGYRCAVNFNVSLKYGPVSNDTSYQ
jgi:hypothetical protein